MPPFARARRRRVSTDNRALEVVLRITALCLWVPYTIAAIHVAYCNSFFIESESGDTTTALAWRHGIESTLHHKYMDPHFFSSSGEQGPNVSADGLSLALSSNSSHVTPLEKLSLLQQMHLSHRYNRLYYHFFPEGFDVLALMASMSHVLFVSAVATALTYMCAVHVENGGEYVMVISWILGVLSESWWLTSSGQVSSLSQQQQFMKDAAPHAAAVDATFILLYGYSIPTPPWWLWLVASMVTGVLSGVLCKVKDITEGKHDRDTHLFRWFDKSPLHTPDRDMATAHISNTTLSSSSASSSPLSSSSSPSSSSPSSSSRGSNAAAARATADASTLRAASVTDSRETNLATSQEVEEGAHTEKANPFSPPPPVLQAESMDSMHERATTVLHATDTTIDGNNCSIRSSNHKDDMKENDVNRTNREQDGEANGTPVRTPRVDFTAKADEASHGADASAAESIDEDATNTDTHESNANMATTATITTTSNNTATHIPSRSDALASHTSTLYSSLHSVSKSPYPSPRGRTRPIPLTAVSVTPVYCPASRRLIGLGERIYTVVPFCTGQWFFFVTQHGWRGIVWGNSIIVLSLGMIGYTMLSYQLLKRQMRSALGRRYHHSRRTLASRQRAGFAKHPERCSGVAAERDGHGNHAASEDAKSGMYGEVSGARVGDYRASVYPDDCDVGLIDDEGVAIDFIELLSKLFTTSFGVVVLVVVSINIFLTSLAIPFIKALFQLNALVSSVGIIIELIVYDII